MGPWGGWRILLVGGYIVGGRNFPGHKFLITWLREQVRAWDALSEPVRILDAEALRIQKTLYPTVVPVV